jgi:hypothetical protein
VVDADDLEEPEKELAMASLWPVPDALGGCSDAAGAAVGGGAGLGAIGRFPMPSAGALTRPTLRWAAAQALARCRLLAGQSGMMVIGHILNGSLRSPAKSPHNWSSRLSNSGGSMDRNRLVLNHRPERSSASVSASPPSSSAARWRRKLSSTT